MFTLDSLAALETILQNLPSTSLGIFNSCVSRQWSRKKRDLNFGLKENSGSVTKDDESSRNIFLMELIKEKIKNSLLTTSQILHKACDKLYSRYHYNVINDNENVGVKVYISESSNEVQFCRNKKFISSCMVRHRLFHCGGAYENSGIVEKIAESVAKRFSATIKTRENLRVEVENLIIKLKYFYKNIPIDYVVDATEEALLYCSNQRIASTLECPAYSMEFFQYVSLAWFGQLSYSEENVRRRREELVY